MPKIAASTTGPGLPRTLCPILVERVDEMSVLDTALVAAVGGAGGLIAIGGDAGIGKSRLLTELCARAEAAGLAVLRGGCGETDLQVPYLPFIEALRRQGRRSSEPARRRELDDLFGPPSTSVDPTQERVRIFESVVHVIEQIAGDDGAVLAIEDLHWSDSGTRDLLEYVARSLAGSRVLLLVTYRTDETTRAHPLQPLLRGLVQHGVASVLELRPLSPAGIAAMLEATIGRQEAALTARLHARSEGNPFVLEEMLKTGGLDLAEPPLPTSVRDAILRRVERLEPRHLDVLRAAAVLAEPIDDAILVDLLGDGVPDALDRCAREQLLTALPDGTYAWRHALTREAVYQDMAPARRRRLHSELADLCDRRRGIDEVVICGHLAAAGRWDEAVPRCRQAAAAATAIGAFADAARLLELCLPHVAAPSEQADILEEIAELRVQSGSPEAGESNARRALEIQGRLAVPSTRARARRTLALSLWQQARWAEAIDQERLAIVDLEPGGAAGALVGALARLAGWTMLGEGDVPAATSLVERARRLAVTAGVEPRLYRADEGQVLVAAGRVAEGLAILDGAWRSALGGSGSRGAAWREAKFMLHHAVAIRNLLGLTRESLAILAEAQAYRTTQDVADLSLTLVESEALWAHGETPKARRLLESLDLGRVERVLVPWAQCVRADVLLSSGEAAAAALLARTALPPHWQPVSQLRAAGLIRVLVAVGDLTGALELARRLDRLGGYGIELRVPFIDAAVEAYLAAGRPAVAAELAAQAAHAQPDDPHRLRVEGRMRLAAGDATGAAERFRSASDGFVRTGHRQDEWRTRRLLARARQAAGLRRESQAELRHLAEDEASVSGAGLAAPATGSMPALSPRERDVALLVAKGLRNREIAEQLFLSERTVENHIHRILDRSGLRSRAELAVRMTTLSGELSGSPG